MYTISLGTCVFLRSCGQCLCSDLFILDTDASDSAIGCVLSQRLDGVEKVIAYGSKMLSTSQRSYCVTYRELLAVVEFVRHYKTLFVGETISVEDRS